MSPALIPYSGSPWCDPFAHWVQIKGRSTAVEAQACCDAQTGGQTPWYQAGAHPLQAKAYGGAPASQCLIASNTSTRSDLGEEVNFHRDIARQTGYISAWFLLHSTGLLALRTCFMSQHTFLLCFIHRNVWTFWEMFSTMCIAVNNSLWEKSLFSKESLQERSLTNL